MDRIRVSARSLAPHVRRRSTMSPSPPSRPPLKATNSRSDPTSGSRPAAVGHAAACDKLLATLNAAQRRAVTSDADTVAILAGPGSGKTHTLASRVVWLIDRTGYRPQDVVVATFTVKAAREMKERIGRVLGSESERKIVLGTFHGIARRYLAAYGKHIGLDPKFGIADDVDSRAIIQRICKRLQTTTPVDPAAARSWISKKKAKGSTGESPGNARQVMKPPTAIDQLLEAVLADYQAQLARSNLLDYDDLLVRCVELLRNHPSCVSNVHAVLVDEYQDTNGIQYELMKLLAQARQRITVVGDPDQSIYGWRSAEVRNLYRLLREFPATEEVALEENYRSSRAILALSLAVIQEDKKRYQKVLKPIRGRGARPVLRKLRSAQAEGEWMVSEILRITRMTGGLIKLQDVAILLRTAALSRHIESALGKAGIAYRMVGGFKFYDRIEVKIVLDYLRVIYQPDNNDAVARILNVPRRGIGEITIKNLIEEAENAKLSLWTLLVKHCRGDRTAKTSIKKAVEHKLSGDLIKTINAARKRIEEGGYSLVDLIDQLVEKLKLQTYLTENYPDDHEPRWANVRDFITLAGDFVRDLGGPTADDTLPAINGIAQTADVDALAKFLANVSLASDAQTGRDSNLDESAVVTISTIHAAKGLEWPVVFVPAVYSGSIPHSRAEDLDEERRLLYVAMTRAKASLYLSWPVLTQAQGGNGGQKAELSPFLSEVVIKSFAKRGPLFDKHVVEEMGKILGREVPDQAEVFGKMLLNAAADDDLFPEDPDEERQKRGFGRNFISHDDGEGRSSNKRQRRTYGRENMGMDVEILGQKDYVTTMDRASNFTMASLPGFITASAHRLATAVAAAPAAVAAPSTLAKSGALHNARSSGPGAKQTIDADQKTLHGFVSGNNNNNNNNNNTAPSLPGSFTRTASLPAPGHKGTRGEPQTTSRSDIDPSLKNHRLSRGPTLHSPLPAMLSRGDDDVSDKQYAFLSSSPPRPPAKDPDGPPPSSPAEPSQPVACLHTTTATMVPGARASFVRPQRPQMGGGLAPMERLRKPFKPLTMNR